MPGLEVFRKDRIALGYLYENWSGGAKWRIQTISSPLSPGEMGRSPSPSLLLHFSPRLSFCRALVSRSDRPSSFDRRHKTASPVRSQLKSFSRHPLIKFRNRSFSFPPRVVRDHAQIIDRVGERCRSIIASL